LPEGSAMLIDIEKKYDCHPKTILLEDGTYFAYVEVFLDGVQMQTGEFGKAGIFATHEEAEAASIELCKRITARYNK
jgi:hypothetical protein